MSRRHPSLVTGARPFSSLLSVIAVAFIAFAASAMPVAALAAPKTVCTITVNSSDEKEAFRRYLPAGDYQFVELVERGRPDWLKSAREKGIRCDLLIISGHYDGGDYAGGNEFFSEHVDSHEYLPVDEMERVACSEPDDGLFSELKAVYLFGCNTLNPEALLSAPSQIAKTLVQSGHAPADAERLSRALSARYADSSRDRMRHIFKDVPAIYGFSSVAPLGPVAATYLRRYFQSGGRSQPGGRADVRLLGYFPGRSLTVTRGSTRTDPDAAFRDEVCQLLDDRRSIVDKIESVHRLLQRDMAEVRLLLDRFERFEASLGDEERRAPDVARALEAIANDQDTRGRYLAFMRNGDQPSTRARLIQLASELGWLSASEKRAEMMQMIGERFARLTVTPGDVDLVCGLNRNRDLDGEIQRLPDTAHNDDAGHAALLACLGSAQANDRVVQALTSSRDDDVQIAQVYLRYRPIDDVAELRGVATGIALMTDSVAQARALDTLARHRLSDPETLEGLTRLFPVARSVSVQRAIAGILIRSDCDGISRPELLRALQEHRLKSPDGEDLIDVLIRRLQTIS